MAGKSSSMYGGKVNFKGNIRAQRNAFLMVMLWLNPILIVEIVGSSMSHNVTIFPSIVFTISFILMFIYGLMANVKPPFPSFGYYYVGLPLLGVFIIGITIAKADYAFGAQLICGILTGASNGWGALFCKAWLKGRKEWNEKHPDKPC